MAHEHKYVSGPMTQTIQVGTVRYRPRGMQLVCEECGEPQHKAKFLLDAKIAAGFDPNKGVWASRPDARPGQTQKQLEAEMNGAWEDCLAP